MTASSVEFPVLDRIASWTRGEPDDRFVLAEFGPGLSYYRLRLQRLSFSGSRVLDAGCGMGQWSAALAHSFRSVDSLDPNSARLDVLRNLGAELGLTNIVPVEGSIEELPYEDDCFDAVFCYGVIMFADVERSLAEFARVLRPGGRGYVCLNGDGFSWYLADVRGDDASRTAAFETLYNTYWRRALEAGLAQELQHVADTRGREWRLRLALAGRLASTRSAMARLGPRMALGVLGGPAGQRLFYEVDVLPESYRLRLFEDVRRLFLGEGPPTRRTGAQNHLPDEFAARVARAGLEAFAWAPESGLVCDVTVPEPEPRYEGWHKGVTAVWECSFSRGGPTRPEPSLSFHPERATAERRRSLFVAWGPDPVLSNRNAEASPSTMVAEARSLARALGGDAYLAALAEKVVAGASEPEDAARRLVCFVQQSLYRDPIVQPLENDGGIPDALTILCCARGRCGHAARLVVALAQAAGLEARILQLSLHVVAEVRAGDRWVVADADAFKNGIIPENANGAMLTMDEIREHPYILDRYPPTGWSVRPGTESTRDALGVPVRGYVDALDPDVRGYLSGYYVPSVAGRPPSVPDEPVLERDGSRVVFRWKPSTVRSGRLVGYRVRVGTRSRGWRYETARAGDEVERQTLDDVLEAETTRCEVVLDPAPSGRLFASVAAVGDRIDVEPGTWFWPSEEASVEPAPGPG